ncbi:MAG: phosphoribosylanthranilate isomerase [Burkholderiales bacterium]|nr:phosphoribosylanthranilate isomerase [Burkholderiales bacterium]
MTRVKICGITRVDDAQVAVSAGADAIGLVFHAGSPRYITISRAGGICAALPPFVTTVALFVDAQASVVESVLSALPIDLLQFHGEESAVFCEQFGKPFMKAVRVRPQTDLLQYALDFASAKALLLDAYVSGVAGGTGKTFDWDLIPANLPLPVVLSGGLTPANVADAVDKLRPWAVDVNSGVEASPGIKDPVKIRDFIKAARKADAAA